MKLSREAAFRFVWLIGTVSLLSDMTYQGAHGNAGPYLALLGASGTIVGLVAGAGEAINLSLRLLFGYLTDRTRRYWVIAFCGYALNLLAVPCLALAGHWPAAAALLILERTGKGIRTPARDVMLSHAADQVGRGWAFGVHEALDQTGGMLGPMLVAGMLFLHKGYRASFAILAVPATLALILLVVTWRQYRQPAPSSRAPTGLSTKGLPRTFWWLIAGVGGLAVGYADFALMAFHFTQRALIATAWIPVCYGVAMGVQGLSSLMFGHLFDRWNVAALLVAAVPAMAFAPLVFLGRTAAALVGLGLWAVGLGAQSAIMKAMVAELVAADRRGSAYGVLNCTYGVLWFAGSAVMGWCYDHSTVALVAFSVAAQLVAIVVLLLLASITPRSA